MNRKVGRAVLSPPDRGAVRTPRPTSWGFMAPMRGWKTVGAATIAGCFYRALRLCRSLDDGLDERRQLRPCIGKFEGRSQSFARRSGLGLVKCVDATKNRAHGNGFAGFDQLVHAQVHVDNRGFRETTAAKVANDFTHHTRVATGNEPLPRGAVFH